MSKAASFLRSSVGRKWLNALSGLALFAFILVHLGGNLTIFFGTDGKLFNSYAHHLEALGPLLWVAEAGLAFIFITHIFSAISVHFAKNRARKDEYAVHASKGGPSRQSIASRSMLITGIVLLIFVPVHVWMFKFGTYYGTDLHGHEIRDLYRLVVEEFKKPVIMWGYVAVMTLLGLHLRHGFWSSLQTLSLLKPKWSPVIYSAGLVLAILLAGGFLILPLYIHFFAPMPGGVAP